MKPNLTMHDIYVAVESVLTSNFEIVIQYKGLKIVYESPIQMTEISLLDKTLRELGFELETLYPAGDTAIEMLTEEIESKEAV